MKNLLFLLISSQILLWSCSKPKPDFTYQVNPDNPSKFSFTSTSTDYTSIQWYVDGEWASDDPNFNYVFSKAGYHNVELVLKKGRYAETLLKEVEADIPTKIIIESVTLNTIDYPDQWDDNTSYYSNDEDGSIGPDLALIVGDYNSTNAFSNISADYIDVVQSDLPIIFTPNSYGDSGEYDISDDLVINIHFIDVDHSYIYLDDLVENYSIDVNDYIPGGYYSSSTDYYPTEIKYEGYGYYSNLDFTVNVRWE